MARWLPSACGIAPTPMKAPGLISASVALTTPYTAAFSVSFTFTSPASPAFTVSVEPSTASIGPRTRTVCCCWANVDEAASAASKAAPASRALVIPLIGPPKQRAARKGRHVGNQKRRWLTPISHRRHEAVTADIDTRRRQRPIWLLGCTVDDKVSTRLKLALVARSGGDNRRIGRNNHLLLPILVLDHDRRAIDGGYHRVHDRIGHGAARLLIVR